jgi:PKD repeat protein
MLLNFISRRDRRRLFGTSLGLAVMLVLQAGPAPGAQGGDTTPPAITFRSPGAGATDVSESTSVRVVFSELIRPDFTMELRDAADAPVAADVVYDPETFTATLDPVNDLARSTTYHVTVSGVLDLAGNPMAPATWTFTTSAGRFVDLVLPQTGLTQPTVLEFASDGRLFVAQKDGRVWTYDNIDDPSPTLVIDLRTNVYNYWDRGLLGMALHPQYPQVPYLYVLYTYDAIPGGSAPRWGVPPFTDEGCPTPPGPTGNGCVVTGRLSRFDIGNPGIWPLNEAHEEPLITDWPQQFPSHSVGSLVFGPDGALYASGGEGAGFNNADYGQTPSNPPLGDPPNEGGALRSQDLRTDGDPVTLSGSIIRIDPITGDALPDNPLALHPDPNGRRIVAHGFRNPFRFTIRPGTREIWAGDVGWNNWEEINRVVDPLAGTVANFGWPCYEGQGKQAGYDGADLPICESLYESSEVEPPFFAYGHSATVAGCAPSGGSSISGLAFNSTPGSSYPESFANALFFADYSRNCIWAMRPGASGTPNRNDIVLVQETTGGPIQLTIGPGGDIYYPGFNDGRLHQLRFTGNVPPVASIHASAVSGSAPLTVTFTAVDSMDPEDGALTYSWDLDGDGAFDDATGVEAQRTYQQGVFRVRVRVTDEGGLTDVASQIIFVDQSPPEAVIEKPSSGATWRVGDVITFAGRGDDPDQPSGIPASSLSWEVRLHHCPSGCHVHAVQSFTGVAGGQFVAPDHEYPSHLELTLTVTDETHVQSTKSIVLQPQTVNLTLQSNPAGLPLTLNAATHSTPFTQAVIAGSVNTVSAAPEQTVGGLSYRFVGWSNGLPASHNLVASNPTVLVAHYAPNTGAPTAPQNFVASLIDRTAHLSWEEPAGGLPPTDYVLQAALDEAFTAIVVNQALGSIQRSLTVPDVPAGLFYLRVLAVNPAGLGPPSNVQRIGGPPDPPTNFLATLNGGTVTMNWSPPAGSAVTGYMVEASLDPRFSQIIYSQATAGNVTSLVVPGVPSSTFYLRVRARNGSLVSAPSNVQAIGPGGCTAPPAAATGLVVSKPGGFTVRLAWQPPAGPNPVADYIVQVALNPAFASQLIAISLGSTTPEVVTAAPAGTFFVRIVAVNACGPASPSNVAAVTVP